MASRMALNHVKFKLESEHFGPRHCLTKCALENILLNHTWWSWYHFSQEKLPQTMLPVIASTYCGKYAVPCFSGTPCIYVLHDGIIVCLYFIRLSLYPLRVHQNIQNTVAIYNCPSLADDEHHGLWVMLNNLRTFVSINSSTNMINMTHNSFVQSQSHIGPRGR